LSPYESAQSLSQLEREQYLAGREASRLAQANRLGSPVLPPRHMSVALPRRVYDTIVDVVHQRLCILSDDDSEARHLTAALQLLTALPSGDQAVTLSVPLPEPMPEPLPESLAWSFPNEGLRHRSGHRVVSQYPNLQDTEPEDL
jgi:hypothetical protein